MARLIDKSKTFSRRTFVLGSLQMFGMTALASRLYYLQFVRSEEYRSLSENNSVKLNLIAPQRGFLLDRNGLPFAENEKNYKLYVDATGMKYKEVEALLAKTNEIVTIPEKYLKKALADFKANPYAPPLLLKEYLTWNEVAKIEISQLSLPNVSIDIGQVRAYPLAEIGAPVTGYVGSVDEKELEKSDNLPLLRLPDYKIGKDGAEKMLEQRMRGKAGIRQLEVNVHGQAVQELSVKPSVPGEHIHLTIDRRLQEYGAKLLEGEAASAMVMDVTNGDMLALISVPSYDPNVFSKGIPQVYWDELRNNPRVPLLNKALQGQYPPGSTFKMLVGLAGLMKGVVQPQSQVYCPGYFYLGNHRFNCWKPEGHGSVNCRSALAQSCDTYFYTVAQRTGIEDIAAVAREFGLGDSTDLGLPNEKDGLIPTAEWKMKSYGQRWTTGDTVNAGIGQGYVLATPMQLAVMSARLATGKAIQPRLVSEEGWEPDFVDLNIPKEYLNIVREGMDAVTNLWNGTAFGKRITEPKYAMAGKTGTSQVRRIERRGMSQEKLPWKYRHHALFVGYAPVQNPRYAVAVAVEHGGGGSSSAAPRARDLLWKMQLLADGIEDDPPTVPVKPLPLLDENE